MTKWQFFVEVTKRYKGDPYMQTIALHLAIWPFPDFEKGEARESNALMAWSTGLSEKTVANRLKILERDGLIPVRTKKDIAEARALTREMNRLRKLDLAE